jgi:HEAT repeat protein
VPPTELLPPPPGWDHLIIDTDLRIQALGSLIKTDAVKVIPMLKQIALEAENPGEARRALFVLAQSGRPEARSTVVEVARTGAEPVRLAAVRELGRLSGPGISNELLQVYSSGNGPVKYQVVTALGERAATTALMQIAESESDTRLRNAAIVTLGQAGGRDQLNVLYRRSNAESKRPIIVGLFNAQADEELIRIAETERDATIRQEVITTLRLLNTRRAQEYLEKAKRK